MPRPALDDAPTLRAWRDGTLYRLLLRASRAEATTTLERLHALGYDDVSLVDTHLLANLDTAGTSISALARRAGVTRQAASQQLAALTARGYVERMSSPHDGRAVLVVQTDKGRALLGDALDIVEAIEDDIARRLGVARVGELKDDLAALLELIDPQGALGTD